MVVVGRAGGMKPLWAIADARQRGKFMAAAMPAAEREEKKERESVLELEGDIGRWGGGLGAGVWEDSLVGLRREREGRGEG